ncbi:MAG: signal peptide peptidase SppA [Eubacteriales bacterium]|nr:signal peptide peptidase SppA [Eubacteriales bacterium]MDD3198917.1 signal peptide peptidase SppA [Eubacteriales bacterium]MDD4122425.1 signal peptide peptidase SppA [Eubacteriales bacterium]MDD4629596.1 signal peptide peptidase SppA [Eubacteriales bacterium]
MTEVREYNIEAMEADKKKNNSRLKKNLIIFGCIIAGIIVFALIGSSIKNAIFGDGNDIQARGPYIATIYVEGTIAKGQTDSFGLPIGYQHNWTLKKINELAADSNNRGIILFVDSPGGGVYESDELYLKLKAYREETGRPVYAVMGSMAASGGYYISAAADKIIANRNTWTGSLGVTIGTLYDITELLEKYGVKTVTITAGENKAMGSIVDPLTEEQKAIFQALVDEAYDQFINIISEEREIGLDEVRKLADGRIYTAKQALKLELIDEIGTIEDAIIDMKTVYALQNCEIIDVIYQDNSLLSSLLGEVRIPDMNSGDFKVIQNIIEDEIKFPISYECELLK